MYFTIPPGALVQKIMTVPRARFPPPASLPLSPQGDVPKEAPRHGGSTQIWV